MVLKKIAICFGREASDFKLGGSKTIGSNPLDRRSSNFIFKNEGKIGDLQTKSGEKTRER